MEVFEITITHSGSSHNLRIECNSADSECRVYRGTEPIGTVTRALEDDLP